MNLTAFENLGVAVQPDASLSEYTTFRLGGKCPAVIICGTPEQLRQTLQFCAQEEIRFILIGSGSNLLVSDDGIDQHVIRYVSEKPLIEREDNDLVVAGSALVDDLAKYTVENGLEGLTYMTGIPGTVGGAVVGNAGAFGKQIGDVTKTVSVIDGTGNSKKISASDLGFTYRNSILKKTNDIVVSVRLSLEAGDQKSLQKERDEILALRREKHPDVHIHPCAGSFFRNIEPTSSASRREAAGWFLEQAGAKQLQSGGAKIFDNHANIIYKSQDCRAQDVYDLSNKMTHAVKDKFDIDLIREVRFVGKFDGMPADIKMTIW